MSSRAAETSVELTCHVCGYDLRAHPEEGSCPECGASVAEARRVGAVPVRPAWWESDPRWRRRVVAGAWVLVFVPLVDLFKVEGWGRDVPWSGLFHWVGVGGTLGQTMVWSSDLYPLLTFCVGVGLLCSKERGRRRARLDWTRRWGVVCSYVVLLLVSAGVLFIGALVLVGISALFLSMPLKYQPGVTDFFVRVSTAYMWYGPQPKAGAGAACVAFSAMAVLLACVPLRDALRASGPKWLWIVLLLPLALLAVVHLSEVGRYCLGIPGGGLADLRWYEIYFAPQLLVGRVPGLGAGMSLPPGPVSGTFGVEMVKWCAVVGIAVWLSVAQVGAWWRRRRTAEVTGVADATG